jgi:hypothetical protein
MLFLLFNVTLQRRHIETLLHQQFFEFQAPILFVTVGTNIGVSMLIVTLLLFVDWHCMMEETRSEKVNEFNSISHCVSCIRMTKFDFSPCLCRIGIRVINLLERIGSGSSVLFVCISLSIGRNIDYMSWIIHLFTLDVACSNFRLAFKTNTWLNTHAGTRL